jgi:hypothetical protein
MPKVGVECKRLRPNGMNRRCDCAPRSKIYCSFSLQRETIVPSFFSEMLLKISPRALYSGLGTEMREELLEHWRNWYSGPLAPNSSRRALRTRKPFRDLQQALGKSLIASIVGQNLAALMCRGP